MKRVFQGLVVLALLAAVAALGFWVDGLLADRDAHRIAIATRSAYDATATQLSVEFYRGTETPMPHEIEAEAICYKGAIIPHLTFTLKAPHPDVWVVLEEGPGGSLYVLELSREIQTLDFVRDNFYPAEIIGSQLINMRPDYPYQAGVIELTDPSKPPTSMVDGHILQLSSPFFTPASCP